MTTENYFADCNTPQEIKAQYQQLAKIYHPARQEYQEDPLPEEEAKTRLSVIGDQYKKALQALDKESFKGEDHKERTFHYNDNAEELIVQIITDLLTIPTPGNTEIWIIGTWIWITKTEKDEAHEDLRKLLKANKFRWNRTRHCWQWSPPGSRSFRSKKSQEDIGELYGAARIKPRQEE